MVCYSIPLFATALLVLVVALLWAGTLNRLTSVVVLLRLCLIASLIALLTAGAILAAHMHDCREIHLYIFARHGAYVTNNRLVVGMLVVELITLSAHITRDIYHFVCGVRALGFVCHLLHKLLEILTIVLKCDASLWVTQLLGCEREV